MMRIARAHALDAARHCACAWRATLRVVSCVLFAALALTACGSAPSPEPRPLKVDPLSIEGLLSLADIGNPSDGLSLSPDGKSAAFFARRTDLACDCYRYRVIVVDAISGEVRAQSDAGGFLFAAPGGGATGRPLRARHFGRAI